MYDTAEDVRPRKIYGHRLHRCNFLGKRIPFKAVSFTLAFLSLQNQSSFTRLLHRLRAPPRLCTFPFLSFPHALSL